VPLGQLASDAARDAMAVAPDRDVDAEVDDGVVVIGDEGRLRQVVANLVANALVHTPSGTPLHLAVRRDDGQAVLEVRDEGPGMPPDVADHAFERFYRADASRSRHQGGSGLGLSIVLAIVEAHGGRVAIKTAPGAGTAVRVELPI
jgi:two-component system OmpR family sensor kinase